MEHCRDVPYLVIPSGRIITTRLTVTWEVIVLGVHNSRSSSASTTLKKDSFSPTCTSSSVLSSFEGRKKDDRGSCPDGCDSATTILGRTRCIVTQRTVTVILGRSPCLPMLKLRDVMCLFIEDTEPCHIHTQAKVDLATELVVPCRRILDVNSWPGQLLRCCVIAKFAILIFSIL